MAATFQVSPAATVLVRVHWRAEQRREELALHHTPLPALLRDPQQERPPAQRLRVPQRPERQPAAPQEPQQPVLEKPVPERILPVERQPALGTTLDSPVLPVRQQLP